jgi:hypothetical protein
MNTMRSVKLIKRHERVPRRGATVKLAAGPNRWSTAVRSWVVEFQERDRSESLPAFDSLFNDTLLLPERAN